MYKQLKWNQEFDLGNYNLWFTSDLHLFHKNILGLDKRPYKDTHEMYEDILTKWNSKIKDSDHVFILGDVVWGSAKQSITNFCKKTNGHKHLILGNHDKEKEDNLAAFDTVDRMAKIIVHDKPNKDQSIFMSHYPLISWDGSFRGVWDLFGHCHDNLPKEKMVSNQCDVGFSTKWEFINKAYDIYSFEDVKNKINYLNLKRGEIERY